MRVTAVSMRLLAAAGALALLSTACSDDSTRLAKATADTTSTSTTVAPTTTTATTLPPTTRVTAPVPGIGQGARGPEVQNLEERLHAMKYDVGKVDGYYDGMTTNAVIAFQKIHGLKRTGRATDDVFAALATAKTPTSLVPGGGARRVEVDVNRQFLLLFVDNSLYRVLPVSTGNGQRYCVDGDCDYAHTPGGSFKTTWRVKGWHTSRLGRLYNPVFFNGGIAIHGSLSVPVYPASHGCVRIPMASAEWFPSVVPRDTPVYVINGPRAPVPFNEPAPDGTPPSSVPTTTTEPSTTTTTTEPGLFPTTTTAPPTTTTP